MVLSALPGEDPTSKLLSNEKTRFQEEEQPQVYSPKLEYFVVIQKIWVEIVFIFLNFLITFLLYPSIVYSGHLTLFKSADWTIFIFNLMFNFGDFSGRSLGRLRHEYPRPVYVIGVLTRCLLIASTFLMGFNPYNDFWGNNAVIMINALLIGLSNGFFVVAAGNSFPNKLDNHEKEFGGFIISMTINLGIALGSMISLLAFQNIFTSN